VTKGGRVVDRGVLLLVALLATSSCAPDAAPSAAERIIVSGASGQLGELVVEELLSLGTDPGSLILVSRTPEALDRYARMGAETRFGDFTQPESLPAAYEGGDRMLLISINTGVGAERPVLHGNAIDAAVAAGVRHVAYTSFVDLENNDSPLAEDHRRTEALLRESGLAWTMLRNSLYANGIVAQAARMIEEGQVAVSPDQTGVAYVTREDCAAAAAAVLATDGHEFQAYDITGPEVVRSADIARIAEELTGVEIERVEAAAGGGGMLSGPSFQVVSPAVEALTGQPPTSVRELLESNRATLLEAAG
jgi:NAD(P)H dehydrogenase (quinone)